jgi:serine/threonine-protein kinase RsbW
VTVTCWLSQDLFRIEIEDQGEGFDPDAVPDPTSPERLEEPTGRGIMLMRTFMSKVAYNSKGNGVVLEKRRSGSAV